MTVHVYQVLMTNDRTIGESALHWMPIVLEKSFMKCQASLQFLLKIVGGVSLRLDYYPQLMFTIYMYC